MRIIKFDIQYVQHFEVFSISFLKLLVWCVKEKNEIEGYDRIQKCICEKERKDKGTHYNLGYENLK